jgi:hypothetical protein
LRFSDLFAPLSPKCVRNELRIGAPVHPQLIRYGVRNLVLIMHSFMNSAPENTLLIAQKNLCSIGKKS